MASAGPARRAVATWEVPWSLVRQGHSCGTSCVEMTKPRRIGRRGYVPRKSAKGSFEYTYSSLDVDRGRETANQTINPPRHISRMLLALAVKALAFTTLAQCLSIIVLHRMFPYVPNRCASVLELALAPLLPLARKDGRFRLQVFRRKWLYWPLTRARRTLLKLSAVAEEPAVLFVDAGDGTSRRIGRSRLPAKAENRTRFVAISDTHLLHGDVGLPEGDVLIHCGDILVEDRGLTRDANKWEGLLSGFNQWLLEKRKQFRHVLITGGNHDKILEELGAEEASRRLSNGLYLENELIELEVGESLTYRVYASPASRGTKAGRNAAFQYTDDESAEAIWSIVPASVDVLVTHGPPSGILDSLAMSPGCSTLRREAAGRIRPRVHVFGHWHPSNGAVKIDDTVYVNAAVTDFDYAISNHVVVFDLP